MNQEKCCQNKRIIDLEKKVEYMEKVIKALIVGKSDKETTIIKDWEPYGYRNTFEVEMEKVWSFSQYWWEDE